MTLKFGGPSDPERVAQLQAEIERFTGGRVSYGYPVITTGGGWRAEVEGGAIGLRSITLERGHTQEDALAALLEAVQADEAAS